MSLDEVAILAAWTVLIVVFIAIAPRVRSAIRLDRPESQPLLLDPLDFDLDGPIIDMEPA